MIAAVAATDPTAVTAVAGTSFGIARAAGASAGALTGGFFAAAAAGAIEVVVIDKGLHPRRSRWGVVKDVRVLDADDGLAVRVTDA